MRATQFIPEKVKIRIWRGRNSESPPTGIVRPLSTTPEVQKEINRVTGYGADDLEYDNKPLSGYHIMVSGTSDIQVFHPDGCSIDLTLYNIGIILRECKIDCGIIQDELIFIFDKSYKEYILVPYNKDTYEEIKVQSDLFYAAKTNSSELKYGCALDFNGNKFVYLGTYWVSTTSKSGFKCVERYILRSSNGMYMLCTVKAPDSITDEFVYSYPDEDKLMQELENLSSGNKQYFYEIKSFYKSGSYNQHIINFEDFHFGNEKLKKTDFDYDFKRYSSSRKYRSTRESGLPLFEGTDGNIYVSLYQGCPVYSVSTYDIGSRVECVPFDCSTLKPVFEYKDRRLTNVVKMQICAIVIPNLVKK